MERIKMDNTNPLYNLRKNINTKQKFAIGLGVVLAVIVVGFLLAWLSNSNRVKDRSTNSEEQSQESLISTEYNENHKYTLEKYLPASDYAYIKDAEGDYVVVEYWSIKENTAVEKGIVVSVNSCKKEENTAAAEQYLKSMPIDLSEYEVVYLTDTSDITCNQ